MRGPLSSPARHVHSRIGHEGSQDLNVLAAIMSIKSSVYCLARLLDGITHRMQMRHQGQRGAPAMMAPWRRVCTPARMLNMVWLKMYDPVSPAPVSAVTVLLSPASQQPSCSALSSGSGLAS